MTKALKNNLLLLLILALGSCSSYPPIHKMTGYQTIAIGSALGSTARLVAFPESYHVDVSHWNIDKFVMTTLEDAVRTDGRFTVVPPLKTKLNELDDLSPNPNSSLPPRSIFDKALSQVEGVDLLILVVPYAANLAGTGRVYAGFGRIYAGFGSQPYVGMIVTVVDVKQKKILRNVVIGAMRWYHWSQKSETKQTPTTFDSLPSTEKLCAQYEIEELLREELLVALATLNVTRSDWNRVQPSTLDYPISSICDAVDVWNQWKKLNQ